MIIIKGGGISELCNNKGYLGQTFAIKWGTKFYQIKTILGNNVFTYVFQVCNFSKLSFFFSLTNCPNSGNNNYSIRIVKNKLVVKYLVLDLGKMKNHKCMGAYKIVFATYS